MAEFISSDIKARIPAGSNGAMKMKAVPPAFTRALGRCLVITVFGGFVLFLLKPYLVSLFAGAILGTALLPVHRKLSKHFKTERKQALALVAAFAVACILPSGGALYAGVSKIMERMKDPRIASAVGGDENGFAKEVNRWLEANPKVGHLVEKSSIDRDRVVEEASVFLSHGRDSVLRGGSEMLTTFPAAIVSAIVMLLTMYFLFIDHERIEKWFRNLPFFDPNEVRQIGRTFSDTCNSILFASFISGLTQAVLMAATSFLTGFGSPALIGILTFFCSFVPLFGTGVVTVSTILFAALMGKWSAVIGFAIGGACAGLADNLIAPLVVGNRARVHPLITFVSAIAGVEMLGIWGLFIGPVATASLIRLLEVLGAQENGELIPLDGAKALDH